MNRGLPLKVFKTTIIVIAGSDIECTAVQYYNELSMRLIRCLFNFRPKGPFTLSVSDAVSVSISNAKIMEIVS